LASDIDSYSIAMHDSLKLSNEQQLLMRQEARLFVKDKFSEKSFVNGFITQIETLMDI
jgi:hypothetical protein